ncbi:MAG: TRAP transporter substrate-binding protein [Actinomycetia bacterium]|nr:TRAP transporter substrate-binding protein [Actinomycetes bacterium]
MLEIKQRSLRLTGVLLIIGLLSVACGDESGSSPSSITQVVEGVEEPQPDQTSGEVVGEESEAGGEAPTTSSQESVDFGEAVTLNLGHPFPAKHPIQVRALENWAAEVKELTRDTVTIEFFAGGALGPAPQTYENAVSGAADIGWALQGYTPGRFPVTDVIEMPFVFSSALQATNVLWTLYEEFEAFQEEYSDVKLLAMWVHDVGDMWLAEGRVEEIRDLEGLTIRAPSPVQNAVIAALGGNPVALPAPDLYDALERGVIDGLFIPDSGLISFNLFDVISGGVQCNCYVAAQFLAMNLDRWNSLSTAQRSAIDKVSGRVLSQRMGSVYDSISESAAEQLAEAGVVKILLSQQELDRWRQAAQGVIEDWIADNAGAFPSREIYLRMLRLLGI